MSQATFDDEELFGEAADDLRADVTEALEKAEAELPAASDIWDVEAANTAGVLNTLKSALDTSAATEHLREAKKWYTIGEEADAFDDESLAERIEAIESMIEEATEAHEEAASLAATIPTLKGSLEEREGE